MRGNPDNLRRAAAPSAPPPARAEHGLTEMIRAGEPITFRGLAQTAGVSLDFLYRTPRSAPGSSTSAPRSARPAPAPAALPGQDLPTA